MAGTRRPFGLDFRARAARRFSGPGARTSTPARRSSPPKKTFAGFRIERELRRGSAAVVFKACRLFEGAAALSLFRRVALKVLVCPAEEEVERRAQFRREAETASRLDHPHVIRVLEAGEVSGLCYLAMTFVPGPSLGALLADGRRAPLDAVLRWGAELASALTALGRRSLIHCDVKPDNVVINDRTHTAHLTDFGIAREVGAPRLAGEVGFTYGTPPYMAPEQVLARDPLTPRADVYALGATLYRAATGRTVYSARTAAGHMQAHVEAWPLDPRWFAPSLPARFARLLLDCLRKDPARRPTSMELHARLSALRRGLPVSERARAVRGGSGAPSAGRPRRSRRCASSGR